MTVVASGCLDGKRAPLELDKLLGRGTRAITVAASRDPNAKTTLLLLRPGSSVPTLAVKIPMTSTAALAVDAEAHVLEQLPGRLPRDLLATVPRVVARIPCDEGLALVTTAIPGAPLTTRYHRWRHVSHRPSVENDLTMATQWLDRLHTATATGRAPVEYVSRLMLRVGERFVDEPHLDAVLEHLHGIDRRLRRESTPQTVVHGDYWAGNLLVRGPTVVGVVDWESATLRGDPIRDVVRFATSYALYLDRHTRAGLTVHGHPGLRAGVWGAGILFAVDGAGWLPQLVRAFTATNLERLGVPGARYRDALVAGVADAATTADEPEFARHHYAVLAALAGRGERAGTW